MKNKNQPMPLYSSERLTEEQRSSIEFVRMRTNRLLKKNKENRIDSIYKSIVIAIIFFLVSIAFNSTKETLSRDVTLSSIYISFVILAILIICNEIGYHHIDSNLIKEYKFHIWEIVKDTPASLEYNKKSSI